MEEGTASQELWLGTRESVLALCIVLFSVCIYYVVEWHGWPVSKNYIDYTTEKIFNEKLNKSSGT